jgi:hypothetical protein
MPISMIKHLIQEKMMNDITQHQNDDRDGFGNTIINNRLIKGQIIRWSESHGWVDRDGLRPPEILLVIAVTEAVQKWQDKRPIETITVKPLPDVEQLNAGIPKSEWEPGLNGQPKAPYVHQYIVYMIDPGTGTFYTFLNSTIGARISYENLHERVTTMRALRGGRVVPLVRLTQRPFKTAFGPKHRPEFEPVDWRRLGGEDAAAIGRPPTPQLQGPAAVEAQTKPDAAPKVEAKAEANAPDANAAGATIAAMVKVTPPALSEELDDEIPWR